MNTERSKKVCELGKYVLARKGEWLYTGGIGSCVGVVLWDKWHDLAGMIHIQFPSSDLSVNWPGLSNANPKFSPRMALERCADPGLKMMIKEMNNLGSINSFTKAYLAGGSNMFPTLECQDPLLDVGARNIEAVKKVLAEECIPIHFSDLGGHNGRGFGFDVSTGEEEIKIFQQIFKTPISILPSIEERSF